MAVGTHFCQVFHRTLAGLLFAQPQHLDRRFHDVFQNRHVAPQVEMLKHHCQAGTQQTQLLFIRHPQLTVFIAHQVDVLAIDDDRSFTWLLKKVYAAQSQIENMINRVRGNRRRK